MGRRRPPARDGDRSHGDVTRPGPRAGGQGPGRTRTVTGGDRAGDSGVTCHRDGHGDRGFHWQLEVLDSNSEAVQVNSELPVRPVTLPAPGRRPGPTGPRP